MFSFTHSLTFVMNYNSVWSNQTKQNKTIRNRTGPLKVSQSNELSFLFFKPFGLVFFNVYTFSRCIFINVDVHKSHSILFFLLFGVSIEFELNNTLRTEKNPFNSDIPIKWIEAPVRSSNSHFNSHPLSETFSSILNVDFIFNLLRHIYFMEWNSQKQ